MPSITKNQQKGGIELTFTSKPTFEVLTWLKDNKYRWSSFAMVWWKRFNENDWKLVHEHFGVPLPESSIENNPQLPIGTAIEKEHTDDPVVAQKIASDVTEDQLTEICVQADSENKTIIAQVEESHIPMFEKHGFLKQE